MNRRKRRRCIELTGLLPACAVLLLAVEPAWKTRPIPSWTEEDARQVLTDSPWARTVTASLTRLQNEDERREGGGNMGQSHGVGFDDVGDKQVRPKLDIPTVLTKTYLRTLRSRFSCRFAGRPLFPYARQS